MKKITLFGKSIPVAVVLVVLLGGTFAVGATLNYFGQVDGTLSVTGQAVETVGDLDYKVEDWSGQDVVSTVNNIDREVEYRWSTVYDNIADNSSLDDSSAEHAVYEVQDFQMTGTEEETSDEDVENYSVTAYPGIDEVTYRVNFEEDWEEIDPANADLQISNPHSDEETNYHIKYSTDSHTSDGDYNWMFYKPSIEKEDTVKGEEQVLERSEVRDLEVNSEENFFEVTVVRDVGEEQSFGALVHNAHEYSSGSYNGAKTEGFDYDDYEASDNHLVVDTTDLLDESTTIAPNGENKYTVSAYLSSAFDAEEYDYEFGVGLEPLN